MIKYNIIKIFIYLIISFIKNNNFPYYFNIKPILIKHLIYLLIIQWAAIRPGKKFR